MNEILILLNDPPYGTERSYNGLRTALAPAKELLEGARRSSMEELARHTLAAGKVLVS